MGWGLGGRAPNSSNLLSCCGNTAGLGYMGTVEGSKEKVRSDRGPETGNQTSEGDLRLNVLARP